MKIAFYMEDSLEQIVLTPESDSEKSILSKLHDGTRQLSIRKGGFYYCAGGWTRHSADQNSTMLVLHAGDA